jgi:rsbT co-antagonist protein RsbR
MDLTDQEVARRKAFLEFGEEDVKALKALDGVAEDYADLVIEDLYRHFLSYDETRAFFRDPEVLAHVKKKQREYFVQLTRGDYGAAYVANRIQVGLIHQRIDLDVKWYLGAYNFYLRAVMARLFEGVGGKAGAAAATLASLMKLVFFDVSLAIQTYVRTIEQQQQAIRDLSTPILMVRPQLLMLPIIGIIDSFRARQLTENLLKAIRDRRAKVVVMDITGVASVDSKVANHLIQTVAAARLMGARVIITGLSAEVAQSLVTLGVDLSQLNTVGDLQGGMEEAERLLGYEMRRAAAA